MVEMIVFVMGIYTLVFGQLKLPWNLALQGWRAQVALRPVDQQVSTMEHAQMWHLMAQAGSNPSWQPLPG